MISALSDASIQIGDVLDGKYEITDILGEGAMGVVYLAVHRRLQRSVALKTLRAEIAGDAELVARFEREARAASAIGHANIVQVFDAGGGPGLPYLVMEHLIGASLGEIIEREGPLPIERALAICSQVLVGLEAAHGAGIVHRDLKPDNIFICHPQSAHGQGAAQGGGGDPGNADQVKLLDFGISKILTSADPAIVGDGNATRAGMVMGTPLYMSPEQASGRKDLDHRTDLWALACVLYECISGAPPFAGDNYNQILAAVLKGSYVPLVERVPGVPAPLSRVLDRALASDREARYASASDLREALEASGHAAVPAPADALMLAAFDNIADRFLEQEKADRATPPPGLAKSQGSSPPLIGRAGDDRFAPPQPDGPVSLALDIEKPARISRSEKAVAPQSPRRRRRSSQYITRKESGGIGGLVAKLLLLLLVAAGAFAGYRYYTLGYVLPQAAIAKASLHLEVDPARAKVYVDGVQRSEASFDVSTGEEHEVRVRADGRIARQQRFTADTGATLKFKIRLAHELPTIAIEPGLAFSFSANAGELATAKDVDAGDSKLRSFASCAQRLRDAVEGFEEHAEAEALPRALIDECVLALRVGADASPAMPAFDSATLAFAEAIAALDKATRELRESKGAKSRLVRARQTALSKAVQDSKAASRAWTVQENNTQAQWLALELELVRASEPESMHLLLRELAVLSDRFIRARLGNTPSEELHAQLLASYQRAQEASEKASAAYKQSGAAAFLRAMKPLTELAEGKEPLFWHNQAIELFNQLMLPIAIDGPAQPKAAATR